VEDLSRLVAEFCRGEVRSVVASAETPAVAL
jgi:hypothetical protein